MDIDNKITEHDNTDKKLHISGVINSREKIIQKIKDVGFVENFDDKMCNAKIFNKQHENKYWIWKISYLEKEQHMIIFIIDSSNDEDIYFKGKIDNVKDFYDIIRLLEIK